MSRPASPDKISCIMPLRFRAFSLWTIFVAAIAVVIGWSWRERARPVAPPAIQKAVTARALKWSVIKIYPHDDGAFTQGLLWHDGNLIEGTGREGHSELRRVALSTGGVLQRRKLPDDVFGEGVALAGNRLIQISWQNNRAFVWDEKTFAKIGEWKYDGEGWGLTFDGENLIMSDGSDELFFRDPKTFAITKTLPITFNSQPLKNLNELEWINGEVWANVWQTDYIVRIDPRSGVVKSYLDCTGLLGNKSRSGREDVLNGIAYDSQTGRIFITGKWWPKLFEIAVEN
jgi:glutamine cyclotransferase